MTTTFNLEQLVRKNVLKLTPYSSARDEFTGFKNPMIFLDANENPFENGVNRYPDPQQRTLKEVLAKEKGVLDSQIVLGNGSDEVLDFIFRVFCEPKVDNIITLPPTYGMYKVLAEINDVENREVLLNEDFELNTPAILDRIDSNTKLLFICNPNNPTGNTFNNQAIERVLKSFDGIVVIDEAYIDFSSHSSWVNRLEEFPNLIVTQTLSKAYGMAGIRLGICYASKDIIQIINKVKPPYNVNELTQLKALERLENQSLIRSEILSITEWKSKLIKALSELSWITKIYPSEANFLLIKVDNASERYKRLIQKGIVVRDRSSQPLCENTLRITIGTQAENIKLIEVLKTI
ncbi:histidinol-phosphate transaminase [Galbibacter sp.]|uniref:histidinol-phosphate transaminase n=1 Tax=Galbibacter sp. TaxID=2918471 RepID=UPI002B64BA1F|nr:histidinol-phosphate transaminase [Galbibacter sp.]HLV63225.1 histidinol-phosphate transaminase [Galbibacter sp.]